ncbi:ABC-F family ATP-binding cassette domain-containing protein [Wandonia haliotis]|uniref:ABC-F family ATP-binding cassette domain-containing protein n=1 Tax=Wandonia haliotis TaxID=574963 RepID=A0ABP3Y5Y6_9FLAO
MNYLSIEEVTKSYGDRILFKDLTFGIEQGQKAAIVARNGNGKTTLLRCILGVESTDSGRVVFRNDIRVAFLEQSDQLNPNHTIEEEILSHDLPELKAWKAYNDALKAQDDKKITETSEVLNSLHAWEVESRIQQLISVLKLSGVHNPIGELSGGQKKRVALAKVLLADPDFLILDEPTNHLDLDMIEWLENYLSQSKATLLMVTHDRYFLEVVCDTIFELEDQTIYKYKGNFSYYLEKKAEREEQLAATIDKAQNLMRKELDWVRRQPKARGTKQKARLDAFEVTKSVASQKVNKDELELNIKMERIGSKILELHKLGKSYGDKVMLKDFSYVFKKGERVGIVGANGVGKTTFLNMLTGLEEPSKGKVVVGDTVVFGYYRQEQIKIPDDKRLIEVIKDIAEFIPLEKGKELSAAQFLEKFLFPRSVHWNYVSKLSGGEKRRLKLMTVLMANPNFLILDEPTNDLDIFTLSVLEDYLRSFPGCLIVVSHDRYFMDKMVDHIFYFKGDGEIKDILGNYTIYRQELQEDELNKRKEEKAQIVEKTEKSKEVKEKRKLSYKEKIEFESMEEELEKLEDRKKELTDKLSNPDLSGDELNQVSIELTQVMQDIEYKTDRWLELSEFA